MWYTATEITKTAGQTVVRTGETRLDTACCRCWYKNTSRVVSSELSQYNLMHTENADEYEGSA